MVGVGKQQPTGQIQPAQLENIEIVVSGKLRPRSQILSKCKICLWFTVGAKKTYKTQKTKQPVVLDYWDSSSDAQWRKISL